MATPSCATDSSFPMRALWRKGVAMAVILALVLGMMPLPAYGLQDGGSIAAAELAAPSVFGQLDSTQPVAKSGWETVGGYTRYYVDGTAVTGLQRIGSATFYFGYDGIMQKGLVGINGKKYCFDGSTGAMKTDCFQTLYGIRYYFGKDGAAYGGLKKIGKNRYYFDPDSFAMKKGCFKTVSGKRYYFGKNGAAYTGLRKIGKNRYYFNTRTCAMKKNGFQVVKGKRYYFTQNGAAATIGVHKGYIIAYNGRCYKLNLKKTGNKDADARRVAKLIAKCCGPKSIQKDKTRVGRAAYYVSYFCSRCRYTTEGSDYSTPYGVFIARKYSCAGSARALGLVLDYLGYGWTHANENQWTHQWCTLRMDGRRGYADAFLPGGMVGYGRFPLA